MKARLLVLFLCISLAAVAALAVDVPNEDKSFGAAALIGTLLAGMFISDGTPVPRVSAKDISTSERGIREPHLPVLLQIRQTSKGLPRNFGRRQGTFPRLASAQANHVPRQI
jgi:hypothetical protein